MKKLMTGFGFWVGFLLCLFPTNVLADDEETPDGIVISVQGEVYHQNDQGQIRQRVQRGLELTDGSVIVIRAESQVKIFTASGQMVTFSKPGQVQYSSEHIRATKEFDILTVLKTLFSVEKRRKIPSARELDDSFAAWINCLNQKKSARVDLEKIFELMALYEELNFKNRILALSTFLTRQHPKNTAYLNLRKSLESAIRITHSLDIILNDKKVSASEQNIELKFNDYLQVAYYSDSESFLYLFLSSYSATGILETKSLFPRPSSQNTGKTNTKARVLSSTGLILPAKNKAYIVDENTGNEFIWGWSCYGPILDDTVIKKYKARFEKHLSQPVIAIIDLQKIDGPGTCHTLLVRRFKHI